MDPIALATLNLLIGNARDEAAVEMALTGGVFVFEAPSTFAVGGAEASATLGDQAIEAYRVYRVAAGDTLVIENNSAGRFLYLTVGGGIDVEPVLGSRSTYLPGGFGGLDGRPLKNGDRLKIGSKKLLRKHVVADALPARLRPAVSKSEIRFVPSSTDSADEVAGSYRLSASSDRTGYRLEGEPRGGGGSVTSEPVCPGVIQLPPGGEPIILMADAPTAGGYRVMGGVISADLGGLAQKLPGDTVTLVPVSIEKARRELERLSEIETLIEEWCLT